MGQVFAGACLEEDRVAELPTDARGYRASAAVKPNHRSPSRSATLTSRISTGTSTSGPITVAKATCEECPAVV